MAGSTASLDSLTSPSPSPPPNAARKASAASANIRGLDSSSELSELTEDEQENDNQQRPESSIQKSPLKKSRRKRNGMVPPEPWDWAMKKKANVEYDDDQDDAPNNLKDVAKVSANSGLTTGLVPDGAHSAAASTVDEVESEDDDAEPPTKLASRDNSVELTDEEDDARSNAASEDKSDHTDSEGEWSSGHDEDEDEVDEDPPVSRTNENGLIVEDEQDQEQDDIENRPSKSDTTPVVPAAPAGSSIMAGQQLIKTPTPSPSPSPSSSRVSSVDPDQLPDGLLADEADKDVDLDMEAKDEPDAELDLADGHDVDAASEIGGDDNDLDMQPAHRAEALDVLAGIELKFALLREKLYVEKMEDLALEEKFVMQGTHPELIYLQTELQNRHDRRLQLALKRRRYEEQCVSISRKHEENAIWSWWKFERDDLQTKLFTEVNRKKRRLERDRRLQDRPIPTRKLPAPPILQPVNSVTIRDIVKAVPFDNSYSKSRLKRKRIGASIQRRSEPLLHLLSPQEIQADMQLLQTRRSTWTQQAHPELGGSAPVGQPQEYGHFAGDAYAYGPGPSNLAGYSHYIGPQAQTQTANHGGYFQGSENRPYRQPGIHNTIHTQQRPMQGPGQPILHQNSASQNVHAPERRRSMSPPPMASNHEYRSTMTNGLGGHAPPIENTAGVGAYDWSSLPGGSKQGPVNGWGPDTSRRIPGPAGNRNGRIEGREAEHDWDAENRERDMARNGKSHKEDERQFAGPAIQLQQVQQPHRHTAQHQSLQGIPHHHHLIHLHHKSHYHNSHAGSAAGPAQGFLPRRQEHEQASLPPPPPEVTDASSRRNGSSSVETINLVPKTLSNSGSTSTFWKQEEQEFARDRGRPPSGHIFSASQAPSHQPSPLPPGTYERERPQATPFVMTSSSSQSGRGGYNAASGQNTSRKDPWEESYRRPSSVSSPSNSAHFTNTQNSPPPPIIEQTSRPHSGVPPTSHQYNAQSRQSPDLSPRRIAPASPPPTSSYPSQVQSPSRQPYNSVSNHPSPRPSSSTPRTSRPLSPTPAKTMSSSVSYSSYGLPSGPGAPPAVGGALHGPGSRPGDNFVINGHMPLLPPAPSYSSSSSFPGSSSSQMTNSKLESPHLPPAPSKVSIVQLSNAS